MNWFRKQRIYLDYASAPPVLPAAEKAVRDASKFVGNPGAIHAEGVEAKRALDDARARIARILGAKAREIIFTSGLTEANNLCILGFARALERKKRTLADSHWIVSSIEHTSVLDCFAEIERLGGSVTHVDPNEKGIVTAESIGKALRPETAFVSVGWANNEIGTIQPLSRIAETLHTHREKHGSAVIFHSDAGQAPLYLSTTVNSLGVDLLALGGNKLYGPHGVGALFIKNSADLVRVIQGGPQERGLRPGTENVALACGFAAAFEEIVRTREREAKRIAALRDQFASELMDKIPGLVVNGDLRHALPHMLNVSIPESASWRKSEYLTLQLDQKGVAVSTKSACREGEESRSHVVEALIPLALREIEGWRAVNTIRFSLGQETTLLDIERVSDILGLLVKA
ncbi:cysteine desulfurase [Candidatus Kaiserbacteria bacterium]|nr:cysteine desulfurase [Candidatus Kaiserbacteria bacterium]